jgi:hypothetical protein
MAVLDVGSRFVFWGLDGDGHGGHSLDVMW